MSRDTGASQRRATNAIGPVSQIGNLDAALRVFLAERTRLLRVAHRIVGSVAEAEDIVQDAWVRWQRVEWNEIRNPAAFLTTTTTRLAINVIQSARNRHEYSSDIDWLPADSVDPTERLERADAVEQSLGLLAARLTSTQFTALLLHSCFGFSYSEVAERLGTTASNARQLVRRAHVNSIGTEVRRTPSLSRERLVGAFRVASETGDLSGLLDVLLPV
ncbi:sigma-70 family RNA polymerase sigma factor [Agromyces sp. MMS24-JH15]|uniref:sigma-70 family RNA polymerase sigma factor n=1 Tax=Agromyces sp. MMS24-JH15 TaxID=3243765 RepID=UPI003749C57B